MESVGEKVRRLRKERGWSQADLGSKVGMSQGGVAKLEAGNIENPRHLARIALVFGVRLDELDPSLADLPNIDAIAKADTLNPREGTLPVYASAEGGPGQIIRSAEPIDFIPRPIAVQNVRDAYGLIITGTSMEPELEQGDIAVINPALPILTDKTCIFYAEMNGEARATVKRLIKTTADKWHVRQHNPKKDFALSRKEWGIAHRVLSKHYRA